MSCRRASSMWGTHSCERIVNSHQLPPRSLPSKAIDHMPPRLLADSRAQLPILRQPQRSLRNLIHRSRLHQHEMLAVASQFPHHWQIRRDHRSLAGDRFSRTRNPSFVDRGKNPVASKSSKRCRGLLTRILETSRVRKTSISLTSILVRLTKALIRSARWKPITGLWTAQSARSVPSPTHLVC